MNYIVFSLILSAIFAGISFNKKNKMIVAIFTVIVFFSMTAINYFSMPVIAWGFSSMFVQAFWVSVLAILVNPMEKDASYDWDNFSLYRAIPTVLLIIAFFVNGFASWECFNANDYYSKLEVKEVPDTCFNESVHPIPVSKMICVDESLAKKLAGDKLGEYPSLGSQVEIGDMTLKSITGNFKISANKELTFDNNLIWIAPLEHTSYAKWSNNGYTPGYVIVDATDPRKSYLITEVNGQDIQIKYAKEACFGDNIERHLRHNGYSQKGLTDYSFEINPSGEPYWVVTIFENKIGFSGSEAVGVAIVHPQTGEITEYSLENIPSWIDRVQPMSFIADQVKWWGEYKKGWRNSWWAEDGVQRPTRGMSIAYSGGRSHYYTGIESSGKDKATTGFMLIDTKTKQASLYRIKNGVNEVEAMNIAKDQPFAKANEYEADFPILYNVRGVPTYFMTMKGSSGNVVGYCFVAVNNRQAVGSSSTKTDAEKLYLKMLRKTSDDKVSDGPVIKNSKAWTIRDITLEGTTYYILFEEAESRGKEFVGTSEFLRELKWSKKGDKVLISFSEGEGKEVQIDNFNNLNVEI